MRLKQEFLDCLKRAGVERHFQNNNDFLTSFANKNYKFKGKTKKFIEYHAKMINQMSIDGYQVNSIKDIWKSEESIKNPTNAIAKVLDIKFKRVKQILQNKKVLVVNNGDEIHYFTHNFGKANRVLNIKIKSMRFELEAHRILGKSDMIPLGNIEKYGYLKESKESYIENLVKEYYVNNFNL